VIRRGARTIAGAVAVSIVALSACGGGASAIDKWKAAARTACDERYQSINVASSQLTAQATAEQFAAWFTQFFEPAYRKQLDAMRAAGPPDDTAKRLVDDTTAVIDAMAADPGSFAVATDPFTGVDPRWDAYGLAPCGTRGG
jgi:hypothetical protein